LPAVLIGRRTQSDSEKHGHIGWRRPEKNKEKSEKDQEKAELIRLRLQIAVATEGRIDS